MLTSKVGMMLAILFLQSLFVGQIITAATSVPTISWIDCPPDPNVQVLFDACLSVNFHDGGLSKVQEVLMIGCLWSKMNRH